MLVAVAMLSLLAALGRVIGLAWAAGLGAVALAILCMAACDAAQHRRAGRDRRAGGR